MSDLDWHALDTLVLVAGHAIYVAPDFSEPRADESWILQEFQKGEPPFYIEHIQSGIELAAGDDASLLVFSGGHTRPEAGPRSEGQSYWLIAEHVLHWDASVRSRSTTEEHARDSFENLLFGVCRFSEVTGHFPRMVKVVSWQFKEERFDLHRRAIRLPGHRYQFVGVNNPEDLAGAKKGESAAIAQFTKDPYGVRMAPVDSPPEVRKRFLGQKRRERDPFRRQPPYSGSCPVLAPLLTYTGTTPFDGWLPW